MKNSHIGRELRLGGDASFRAKAPIAETYDIPQLAGDMEFCWSMKMIGVGRSMIQCEFSVGRRESRFDGETDIGSGWCL